MRAITDVPVNADLFDQIQMVMADLGYEPPKDGMPVCDALELIRDAFLDLQRRVDK